VVGREIWDVYTSDRKRTGRTHVRGEVLATGDFHLVVVVWIIDSAGRILVTRRHPMKPWPGFWECTGGSVLSGENSLEGALREVREETGLALDPAKGRLAASFAGDDSIYDYWIFRQDLNIDNAVLQADEVTDIKWVTLKELEVMFLSGEMVPNLSRILSLIGAADCPRERTS